MPLSFREIRCPEPCGKLLFTAAGTGATVRIKCKGCGNTVTVSITK